MREALFQTPATVTSVVVLVALAFVAGRVTGKSGGNLETAARRVVYYVDPMHPAYRSDKPGIAPDCGMALEPVYQSESRLANAFLPRGSVSPNIEKQQLIGVRVEPVAKSSGSRMVRTTGRVSVDDNHVYRLIAATDGWIDSLGNNSPGTLVKKNQPLASLYSPDFQTIESSYLGSLANVERLRLNLDANDQKKLEDEFRVIEEELRLLGIGEEQLKELSSTHRTTPYVTLVAPGDGVVLSRSISPRQRFEKGAELYRIADLRKVWIIADIHGKDGEFGPGNRAKVTIPELGKTIEARVGSSTPLFYTTSRTLKLRLEAENPRLLLRPDMFVDVEFPVKTPVRLSVPAEAVLDTGMRKIVYVEMSDGVFEPRPVEIENTYGDRVTLARGVAEGDRIAVAGNFLLDSESRMRATTPTATGLQSEVKTAVQREALHDPVCRMTLSHRDPNLAERYHGETFSFCSESCRKKFRDDPRRYAGEKSASAALAEHHLDHHHD
jgi:Cu(I)/Ag(I) efflux system membrane fusion protein